MARTIVLKAKITEMLPELQHRLQVWVDEYDGVDPRIFVWQRGPAVPGQATPNDFFVNIASVVDLEEYPPGEAIGSSSSSESSSLDLSDIPFFRMSHLDLVFRSVADMTRSWAIIQSDVRALLTNLHRLDTMGTEVTVEITV
jgi:hypothetical protein